MSDIMALNVVGTDGIVPVYDPNARWCWWSINEIYTGASGRKFIPKVGDYVIDPDTFTVYIVEHLDLVTLIPRLVQKTQSDSNELFTDVDRLLGVGTSHNDTYRVYLDTHVVPYTLAVDARLKVPGSFTKYCKIFRGSDLTVSGEVISRVYDASGTLLGNTVQLETAAIRGYDNLTIKSVPPCNCMTRMPDGEEVIIVFYNDTGNVVYKRRLLVENTSYIRAAFNEDKFIVGIGLETPFMSQSFANVIMFPLNVPINALSPIGVVHYSDGSTMKLPVDGTKFKLIGVEQYLSSIEGQKVELVLQYSLSPGEAAYIATPGNNKFITMPMSLITVEPNNAYTVKVYGYPEWVSIHEGYRMKWWMLNLDRNVCTDVSTLVRFSESGGSFEPTGYDFVQNRSISLTLSDVSGAYRAFIHTQVLDILLRGDPAIFGTPWEISQESAANRSLYGQGLRIDRNYNFKDRFTIHSGIDTLENWLDQVYYRTHPMMNALTEARVPVPTHFEVMYMDNVERYTISEWRNELNLGVIIPLYRNVYIKFIKPSVSGDMILSIAAMTVRT